MNTFVAVVRTPFVQVVNPLFLAEVFKLALALLELFGYA